MPFSQELEANYPAVALADSFADIVASNHALNSFRGAFAYPGMLSTHHPMQLKHQCNHRQPRGDTRMIKNAQRSYRQSQISPEQLTRLVLREISLQVDVCTPHRALFPGFSGLIAPSNS